MIFSCKKAAVLLSKYLDDDLSRGEWLRLRCHLLICRACRMIRRQLALQKLIARRLGDEDIMPPSLAQLTLSLESRQRIKAFIKAHGENSHL
jgi:predicted anti-sigma-YlaC factor YlaD